MLFGDPLSLNFTLQELNLAYGGFHNDFNRTHSFSSTSFLELHNIPAKTLRFKLMNTIKKIVDVEIQNLRHHLPHMKIPGDFSWPFVWNIWEIQPNLGDL